MATDKQIRVLVASGELMHTPAADRPEMAAMLIDSQRTCIVCGNGMMVLPWAALVPPTDRLALTVTAPDGGTSPNSVRVTNITVHRFCLLEVSVGGAIAQAASQAKNPCQWDIDGREAVGVALLDGKSIPICEPHARDASVEIVYGIPA